MKRYSSFMPRIEKLEAQRGSGRQNEQERKRRRFEELWWRNCRDGLTPAEQEEYDSLGPGFKQWWSLAWGRARHKKHDEEQLKQKALREQMRQQELAAKRRLANEEKKSKPIRPHEHQEESTQESWEARRQRELLKVEPSQVTIKRLGRPRQETPQERKARTTREKLLAERREGEQRGARMRAQHEAMHKANLDKKNRQS